MSEKKVFQLTTQELTDVVEYAVNSAIAKIVASAATMPAKPPKIKEVEKPADKFPDDGPKRGRPKKVQQEKEPEVYITINKATGMGLLRNEVYYGMKTGKIRHVKDKRRYRVSPSDVKKYLNEKLQRQETKQVKGKLEYPVTTHDAFNHKVD